MSAEQKLELVAKAATEFRGEMEKYMEVSGGCFGSTVTISGSYYEPHLALIRRFARVLDEIPNFRVRDDQESFRYWIKHPEVYARWWGPAQTEGRLSVPRNPELNRALNTALAAMQQVQDFYGHAKLREEPICSIP
jgi:hypothetical protein